MIITLDSNVLISAIVFGGKPRSILELVLEGECRLALSPAILAEVAGVLKGRKFAYPEPAALAVAKELEALAHLVYPQVRLKVITEDPADNRILECARESSSEAIISGDRHLRALKEFKGIPILAPGEFLDRLA